MSGAKEAEPWDGFTFGDCSKCETCGGCPRCNECMCDNLAFSDEYIAGCGSCELGVALLN